jgi:large subunit ribosomal protein L17
MAMLRTMVKDLIRHESIRTTEAKAREVKRMADKVVTFGKKGTLHDRRQALALLTDEGVVRKVFDELAPRYESRPGGYTRMIKLGPRKGDAANMAIVELVP